MPQYQNLWSEDQQSLLGSRHVSGKVVFPAVHPTSPLRDAYEPLSIGREGTLYSFTVIHASPKAGLPPHALGLVNMDDQPVRIFGKLECAGRPRIGQRFAARPDEKFGYVFQECEA